jgi:transcriptional regulator with PAS, ATPase and Fis domain
MLTHMLLRKLSRKNSLQYRALTNEAFNKLYSYSFPGNIRELENILERALNVAEENSIMASDILIGTKEYENSDSKKSLKEILEDSEKKVISNYMKKYAGNKEKVMDELQIKKTSFYEKIKKYNL